MNIHDFFLVTKDIEKKIGRKSNEHKNYPRIIDIDILTFSKIIINSDKLTIPHPKLHKRRFVLLPWCEISNNYQVPGYNKSVFDLLKNVKDVSKVCKLNI